MNDILRWPLSAAALLWIVFFPGWGVLALAGRRLRFGGRAWHAAFIAGTVVSGPILYAAARVPFIGFGGVRSVVAATAAGCLLFLLARRRRGALPDKQRPPLGWGLALAVILVSLTVAAPYLEFATGRDVYANTVSDWNPRQSVVWSIQRFGLPLQETLFFPGRSVARYYPAGSYLAVAAAADVGGASVPQAWPWAIFSAGLFASLCLLARDFACRLFRSRAAGAWAVVLMCVGGLDVVVNLARSAADKSISLGHVTAWAAASGLRIDGVYSGAMWAAPHLASAAAALLAAGMAPLRSPRQWRAILACGLLFAGMFHFSPYVAVAAAAVVGVLLVREAFCRRWRRLAGRLLCLCVAVAIAIALVLPLLADLRSADSSGGQQKIALGLPRASIHPVSRFVAGPVGEAMDTVVQALCGLLPVAALGLAGWRLCPIPAHLRVHGRAMAAAIPTIAVLVLIFHSTGVYNDWGMRATHLLQIAAAILGGGLMASLCRRVGWATVLVLCAVGVGLLSTAWEMAAENAGRFLVVKPANRHELYQAADFIRRNADSQAVVMVDPGIEGMEYARRWSDRRGLMTGYLIAYADAESFAAVRLACREVAETGLGPRQARRLAAFGAGVALVRVQKLSPDLDERRIIYRNRRFAVADLSGNP